MNPVVIGKHMIGERHPVFVVAEIGINHGGDEKTAAQLVRAAAEAGADAVKFQTYVTDLRVPKTSPVYDVLRQCELTHAAQARLAALAGDLGVTFFSTPFDDESVAFLAELGVPAFKLASFDIVNRRLVAAVLAQGKPVIASTGMADREETDRLVENAEASEVPLVLLHCVSAYPTPENAADLRVISRLRAMFDVRVGYSDHTLGVEVAPLAVAAGACVVEKHFTLDRSTPGPDHALSADPAQLRAMVASIRRVESIMGAGELCCREVERAALSFRRPS